MKINCTPQLCEVGKEAFTSDYSITSRVRSSNKIPLLSLFVLLTMVDIAAALLLSSVRSDNQIREWRRPSTFLIVPSKTASISQPNLTRKTCPTFLVPSQVLKAHPGSSSVSSTDPTVESPQGESSLNRKGKQRRKKTTTNKTSNAASPTRPCKYGNLPDIFWRSIPMEHLRHHPNVEPLPLPETIKELESLEDIRLFRQESWQWDAVHQGRCTTSQAVAALGFLEPEAGKLLGVPKSWQRGGLGAYHRLRKPALRTLEEMNEVLCSSNFTSLTTAVIGAKDRTIWSRSNEGFPFAAKYMIRMAPDEIDQRKKMSQAMGNSPGFDFSVRMMWGNSQEAMALLAALNYFWN